MSHTINFLTRRPLVAKLLVILILAVTICSASVYTSYNEQSVQKLMENEFMGKSTKIGSYRNIDSYKSQNPKIYLTEFGLYNAVYSIVLNYTPDINNALGGKDNFLVIIGYLERSNILSDFKVKDFKAVSVRNSTKEILAETVKHKDISTIESLYGQDFDPSEISKKQVQEEEDSYNDLIRRKRTYIYFLNQHNQYIKTGNLDIVKNMLLIAEDAETNLDKAYMYTFPDGSILNADFQHTGDIKAFIYYLKLILSDKNPAYKYKQFMSDSII